MTDAPDLPASGLADEMIPLLRSRLGLSDAMKKPDPVSAPPVLPAPPLAILEFADATRSRDERAAAPAQKVVQIVLFSLGTERYALPIEVVSEILRVLPIARVPQAPAHVRGVMNVRGRLLPVVEIRTILGLGPLDVDGTARVVKATVRGRTVGLLVDQVSYVLSIGEDALEPAPRELGDRATFVSAVVLQDDGVVLLLDLERALALAG